MVTQKVCHEFYSPETKAEYEEVCQNPNYFDPVIDLADGLACVNEFCESTVVTFDDKKIDDRWKNEFR